VGVVNKTGIVLKLQGVEEYCGHTSQVCSGWLLTTHGDLDVYRQFGSRERVLLRNLQKLTTVRTGPSALKAKNGSQMSHLLSSCSRNTNDCTRD